MSFFRQVYAYKPSVFLLAIRLFYLFLKYVYVCMQSTMATVNNTNLLCSTLYANYRLFLLYRCKLWFVRCMKPNTSKSAMLFNTEVISEQVISTGILETIRIRSLGYPYHMTCEQFLDRLVFHYFLTDIDSFSCLLLNTSEPSFCSRFQILS